MTFLSTVEALAVLEGHGVKHSNGLVEEPESHGGHSLLSKSSDSIGAEGARKK